jgi:hypothetical protein
MICPKPRFCDVTVLLLVFYALASTSILRAQTLNSNLPPGGNFNLTNWYLGLPVDSSGGTSGDSASISAAQLTGGYSNALYFYTGTDGAMTFWAPVTGATTSGSSYPRSELREQITPPSNDINWRGYGMHILTATCKVTQVASTSKVIIGQIHTKTGDARPLVKLQYNDGTIEALVKQYASDTMPNTDNKLTFQNVGLNNSFNYTIQNENGLVTVTVNGLTKSTNTFLTDPLWTSQEFYYKAGSYCQDNVGSSSEGARVAFYALSRSHAPSITNQPVPVSIGAGGTTNFSVSATGNGTLFYQWRLNDTNLAGSSTGATLTLANVQLSQAGNYSVRVADSLGSVTSAVVSLMVTNAATNTPPAFTSDPLIKSGGTVGLLYSGSLAGDAADPDAGETLAFTKVSGPAWLNVAGNGSLSGTPGAGDVGTNNWTVRVTDLASASNQATLRIVVSATPTSGTTTNLVVDDSWSDAGRDDGGDALDTDWWTSTGSTAIEVGSGFLGLVSGSSGRGVHGTFTPQSLNVGDTLQATFTFTTPATVAGGAGISTALRIGLFDTTGKPGLAADLTASSGSPNAIYNNLSGYMTDWDVNIGAAADTAIRERTAPGSGLLLATTADYTSLGDSANVGYAFLPSTSYVGTFSITRTLGGIDLTTTLSEGLTPLDSFTVADATATATTYGMIAFHVGGNAFGAVNTVGTPNNGIDFTNVKVVVVRPAAPVIQPTLDISITGGNVVVSWLTNGSAGFLLESTASLSPSGWSAAGSPATIGDRNYVTNQATGSANFYRLKKP